MTNVNQLKQREDIFSRIFSNLGTIQNYWPKNYKKAYIRRLQKDFNLSRSKKSEKSLPVSILEEENVKSLLEIVKNYDKELLIFQEFYMNYETYGRKEVLAIDIGDIPNLDKIGLRDGKSEYSLEYNQDWQAIYSSESKDKISIVLGKASYKPLSADLSRGDFSTDDQWNAIISASQDKTKENIEELLKVQIKAVIPKRTVLTLSVDKENKVLEVTHDNFEVTAEGKKVKKIDKYSEIDKAYDTALSILNIETTTQTQIKDLIKDGKKNIISNIEISQLQKYSDKDMILVFSRQDFYVSDDIYDQLDEEVNSKLAKQQISEVMTNAKDYYDENGKLTGFFEKYKQFDITNSQIGGSLISDEKNSNRDVDQRSFHAHAILIREKSEYDDVRNHHENHFKDKVMETISFEYDFANGCLDIRNSNYSELLHETLISRIRAIYKGK